MLDGSMPEFETYVAIYQTSEGLGYMEMEATDFRYAFNEWTSRRLKGWNLRLLAKRKGFDWQLVEMNTRAHAEVVFL